MSTSTPRPADPSSASAQSSTSHPLTQPSRPAPLVELWQPWISRAWPCTARDEQAFVRHMTELAGRAPGASARYDRRDVTALVTALRSGLSAAELLEQARGLRPERLLAAHAHLDGARVAAADAWRTLVRTPTPAALLHVAPVAAMLLPAIVSQLEAIAHRAPGDLARSVQLADAEIARTSARIVELEERLDTCTPPSDRGRAIGSLLFDAYGDGAWSLSTFLPDRVGTLVPLPRRRPARRGGSGAVAPGGVIHNPSGANCGGPHGPFAARPRGDRRRP